jgi:hypothetical protein
MKKNTKTGIVLLTTLLLSTAFTLKEKNDIHIDKFNHQSSCTNINKSSNGTKVAYTMSAHDQTAPGTCVDCHSGGSATPVATITATPAFGAGNTYVAGTTYSITYQVSGYPSYGFDLEMNDGNTTTSMTAGTLSGSAGTHTKYTAAGTYPANISHNATILSTNAATFTWVAPTNGATVYLFSNALGVNGTGGTGGDKEIFKNMILTPATGGIEEVTVLNDLKLFPNPSQGETNLCFNLTANSHVTIEITDLNGKIISTQTDKNLNAGDYTEKLDLQNIENGNYLVRLQSNNKVITEKLFIQK